MSADDRIVLEPLVGETFVGPRFDLSYRFHGIEWSVAIAQVYRVDGGEPQLIRKGWRSAEVLPLGTSTVPLRELTEAFIELRKWVDEFLEEVGGVRCAPVEARGWLAKWWADMRFRRWHR